MWLHFLLGTVFLTLWEFWPKKEICQKFIENTIILIGVVHTVVYNVVIIFGHGAMPGTKKMPDLDIILKVVIPIRPLHSFFPFQNLCLYQACLRRDLLSHMITNINCKCNLNVNFAHYSTNFLCKTSKIILQKWAVSMVLIMRKKLLLSHAFSTRISSTI